MKPSRVTFNKRNKIIQFWIPIAPYIRQYKLTERNQKRIEQCMSVLDWHYSDFQEMTIYTRRRTA